eukprot:gene15845-24213_t
MNVSECVFEVDEGVKIAHGVTREALGEESARKPFVVVTHGLGTPKPTERSWKTDEWVGQVIAGCQDLSVRCPFAAMDARGQGASSWAGDCAWKLLGGDMLRLAEHHGRSPFVAAGQSQGAAASLEAAMASPDSVSALILLRLPTFWQTREGSRVALQKAAALLESGTQDQLVLLSAAGTDLSFGPPSVVADALGSKPALILCTENDAAHPTQSSRLVHELLPKSRLVVSQNEDEARTAWPQLIRDFLAAL